MAKIMGFANLHGNKSLGPLSENRPLGSTSFLGRYALMDFTLSNFSNSGIDKVGILIETQPRSIMKHLGSTNVFNNNTKLGFEQVLYNEKNANNPLYNHDLNNLKANDWLILDHKPDVIVIAPIDLLYTLDFRPIIKQHLENQEPITLVISKVKQAKKQFLLADSVTLTQGRVSNMIQNQGTKEELDISLDTYVISTSFLNQMMDMGPKISSTFGVKEILHFLLTQEKQTFAAYRYTGYVRPFESLESYFENSMAFLDYGFRNKFFTDDWPIYTVSHNTAPARFGSSSVVQNSMIANGAKIYGTVINSIISRNVTIEVGATVKDSIIFTDSRVGKDVTIQHAIIDKYVRVEKTKLLAGKDIPLYIKQGEKI
jgi:glucose-1-phosphate adenylyltransferase